MRAAWGGTGGRWGSPSGGGTPPSAGERNPPLPSRNAPQLNTYTAPNSSAMAARNLSVVTNLWNASAQ
jgi:hypothetical protein